MADRQIALAIAASLIRGFEGCRLEPYICQAGKLTVGYGHVTDDRRKILPSQAEGFLLDDLNKTAAAIRLPWDKMTDKQAAACISLAFNIGAGAFNRSSLLAAIRIGEKPKWCAGLFEAWVYVRQNGKLVRSKGLASRRQAEAALYMLQ